jgi:hypothetical protein
VTTTGPPSPTSARRRRATTRARPTSPTPSGTYFATTYDGGKTWVSSDATPSDPVQRGSICTGGTTCGDDRNLLDFIDVTVDKTGHVEAAIADGCIAACVTDKSHNSDVGPADAQAAYATIVRQSSGLGLFSAYDPQPKAVKKKKRGVQ